MLLSLFKSINERSYSRKTKMRTISEYGDHTKTTQKKRRVSTSQKAKRPCRPNVISLFTCGMGLDIGFSRAGFATRYTNDITKFACDTIRENRGDIYCDEGDITKITSEQILERSGLKAREVDIVVGGPPCQPFSTAGTRSGFGDKRGLALLQYVRIVSDIRPKFFVFENVPGLISASKKHVSFYDRMSKGRNIRKDEQYGSLFKDIWSEFAKLNRYKIQRRILNAADYGVPQKRRRLVLIGSRVADPNKIFEEIDRSARFADPKKPLDGKRPWKTLRDALSDLYDPDVEHVNFPKWGKYLKDVPPGGCWVDLPESIKAEAMGGAADSDDPKKKGKQGGRRGFFRRLSWNAPAPTLVTSPTHLSSCVCHPDMLRPLSVREYARLQGFPDSWKFVGSTSQKYRMIAEAVPIDLARIIATAIRKHL